MDESSQNPSIDEVLPTLAGAIGQAEEAGLR